MEHLIEARKRAGLTQAQVADRINVGRTTYVKYETGVIEIPCESLIKISKVLNTSIDYIVGNSDNPFMIEKSTEMKEKELILKLLARASDDQLRRIVQFIRFTLSES